MYLPRQAGPPNFRDVSMANHGESIMTITGFFTIFACSVVLARLYVRAVMLKTFGIDDYIMTVAMVCSATVFACFVEEIKLGVGEHMGNPQVTNNVSVILHWSYFHSWLLVIGITSVKLSVGFFLLRLVQGKWYKRFIIAWQTFLVAFMLACVGTLVFQCLPVNAAWNFMLRMDPKTKCFSTSTFRAIGLFNGSINIFTDFLFASLPIPVILPLQINLRTKVSLVCILSLGYFACAASIVKEVLLSQFFSNLDPFFNDSFQVWNDIEMNTGILAACLPALRPLFASLLETANAISRSGIRPHGIRHHYFLQEEDVKLATIPSRSTLGKHSYGVSVMAAGKRASGSEDGSTVYGQGSVSPMSKLEQSVIENDSGSEETILPIYSNGRVHLPPRDIRRGIMRTTEVMVSR